jgi:hypothetical protein
MAARHRTGSSPSRGAGQWPSTALTGVAWRIRTTPAPRVAAHVTDGRHESMLDYGDVLVDEHSQLFTPTGEPIWVTNDGRHIPLTQLDDEHLAAIHGFLQEDETRHSTWIGYVDGEIARRSHAS